MFDQIPEMDREEKKRQKMARRERFVLAALAGGNPAKDCVAIADLVIAILDQE